MTCPNQAGNRRHEEDDYDGDLLSRPEASPASPGRDRRGVDAPPDKRAADKDARGMRKLPFFVDPISGTLKIEKGTLVRIYRDLQVDAENSAKR